MQRKYSPLLACGESSAAGGFPAVGDWRKRKACRRHTRSVPKAYPEGEGLGVGSKSYCIKCKPL
ncbi:hypothetical protein NIES4073_75140 [Kalymmatonema gypsitolerans NIES-4073]|nr:hypothetical protein NIES4073_75140 [Scytonema sp. NIES-4073]